MAKMREYLQMDTEIPFQEFRDYYEQLLGYLKTNYEGMNSDELIQTRYILDIVSNNSQTRGARKDADSKKYKKISEKCSFWSDAVNFRLQNNGMTQQEIDDRVGQLTEEN